MASLRSSGSSGGNLVMDAQIAALAMAHGGTVDAADQEIRRFRDLLCKFPLEARRIGEGRFVNPPLQRIQDDRRVA